MLTERSKRSAGRCGLVLVALIDGDATILPRARVEVYHKG
jgi:hypothetical protein